MSNTHNENSRPTFETTELDVGMIELMAFGPVGSEVGWGGPDLPDGVDLTEPESPRNSCQIGEDCAGARNGRGAPIGYHLIEIQDTYDSGAERLAWLTPFLVEGDGLRVVVCEDCACAIEDGDLSPDTDGNWWWADPNAGAQLTAQDLGFPKGPVDR